MTGDPHREMVKKALDFDDDFPIQKEIKQVIKQSFIHSPRNKWRIPVELKLLNGALDQIEELRQEIARLRKDRAPMELPNMADFPQGDDPLTGSF